MEIGKLQITVTELMREKLIKTISQAAIFIILPCF